MTVHSVPDVDTWVQVTSHTVRRFSVRHVLMNKTSPKLRAEGLSLHRPMIGLTMGVTKNRQGNEPSPTKISYTS